MKRRWASNTPVLDHVLALPWWHRAIRRGTTLFEKRRTHVSLVDRVLISGVNNRKIGSHIAKGRLTGAPIFTLTLEERATCPKSCQQWSVCYGNNMNWPKRLVHGPELEKRLEQELSDLNERHPDGFMIRLHVLGDFYSIRYVRLWKRWLTWFPALHVYGYTAWSIKSKIGRAIADLRNEQWDRFAIRTSGGRGRKSTVVLYDSKPVEGVIRCPVETDQTACCGSCGLCWNSEKRIGFILH